LGLLNHTRTFTNHKLTAKDDSSGILFPGNGFNVNADLRCWIFDAMLQNDANVDGGRTTVIVSFEIQKDQNWIEKISLSTYRLV
jgi:hypothetical protein